MLISGLGGQKLSKAHAHNSAMAISAIKPDFLSFLSMLLEDSRIEDELHHAYGFTELSPMEILEETLLFLQDVDLEDTVFRMNHSSNYLSLRVN